MDSAIKAEQLGKCYRMYASPKGRLVEMLSFGRLTRHTPMWALRGVNIDVKPGESIGFIGENGAGKSTLLRLLCGATSPSSGTLTVRGRKAALLELGTGFHPEFSGRQNAFFNGILMGLKRADIERRIEEIKDFSELGDFFDRPVKTYSSGMVVRLGFSIATSVDPDVLIVDEALSVGDEHFQKKSLDRMLQFRKRGKTIAFVSHSMYHVRQICDRACWIHAGGVRVEGPVDAVIGAYDQHNLQRDGLAQSSDEKKLPQAPQMEGRPRVVACHLETLGGEKTDHIACGEGVRLVMEYDAGSAGAGLHMGFYLDQRHEATGATLTLFGHTTRGDGLSPVTAPAGRAVAEFPSLPFRAGSYQFVAGILDDTGCLLYDMVHIPFSITANAEVYGLMQTPHRWDVKGR